MGRAPGWRQRMCRWRRSATLRFLSCKEPRPSLWAGPGGAARPCSNGFWGRSLPRPRRERQAPSSWCRRPRRSKPARTPLAMRLLPPLAQPPSCRPLVRRSSTAAPRGLGSPHARTHKTTGRSRPAPQCKPTRLSRGSSWIAWKLPAGACFWNRHPAQRRPRPGRPATPSWRARTAALLGSPRWEASPGRPGRHASPGFGSATSSDCPTGRPSRPSPRSDPKRHRTPNLRQWPASPRVPAS
mmetsp:Transcript_63341/g.193768  ORF Transcript_63341/g.193768 Transcript_63341/m.193768 type:complete len:241 (+) Transcript_63341:243-965(+)